MSHRKRGSFGASIAGALALAGCPSTPSTNEGTGALSVWITTDLGVPRDLDGIVFDAADGQKLLAHQELGLEGRSSGAQGSFLPHRFSVDPLPTAKGREVRLRVVGLRKGTPVVMAEAWTVMPSAGRRKVRMDLSYLCHGAKSVRSTVDGQAQSACPGKTTCVGGRCVPATEWGALVDGKEAETAATFGTDDRCWDVAACFSQTQGTSPPRWDGSECIVDGPIGSNPKANLALVPSVGGMGMVGPDGRSLVPLRKGDGPGDYRWNTNRWSLPAGACDGTVAAVVSSEGCDPVGALQGYCSPSGDMGSALPSGAPREGDDPAHGRSGEPTQGEAKPEPPGPSDPDGGTQPTVCHRGLRGVPTGGQGILVEGTVRGLDEAGLVLLLNRTFEVPLAPGVSHFAFSQARPLGSSYEVSLGQTPRGKTCTLHHAVGQVGETSRPVELVCAPRPKVQQMAVGMLHMCVVLEGGAVRCWGSNADGQTGGATAQTSVPGLNRVLRVAAGDYHTCAVLDDRTVRCWGSDRYGQLGGSSLAKNIAGLSGVLELKAGRFHTCARLEDGTVRCWGAEGVQVDGGQKAGSSPSESIPGLSGVVELASGAFHTCALRSDGTVRCWGLGSTGQTAGSSPTRSISGLSGVRSLSAQLNDTCAVLEAGTVRCWGDPTGNVLAGGSPSRDIPGITGVVEVAVGGNSNVWARKADGSTQCWGNGMTCPAGAPGESLVALAAGTDLVCGITRNEEVLCRGLNNFGVLASETRARALEGLSGVVQLRIGSTAAGALRTDGTVRLWGQGQPTLTDPDGTSAEENLAGLTGIRDLAMSNNGACVLMADTTVRCGGFQHHLERVGLRDGPYHGLSGVVRLSGGFYNLCAIRLDGTVRCWGDSEEALAGASPDKAVPIRRGVRKVVVGGAFACALMDEGTVRCWGANASGQLGGASLTQDVPGLSGVLDLAAGAVHACASRVDGTVRCWGDNGLGQTGGSSPTLPLAGLSEVVQLEAGTYHTCALAQNGTVRCWGARHGDQTGGSSPSTAIPFVEGAVGMAAGGHTACAIVCDGRIVCWGDDSAGQASGKTTFMPQVAPITP